MVATDMSGASENVLLIPEETLADFRTIVEEWGTFRQVKAYQEDKLEEVLENSSANSTLVLDMRLWRRGRDEWGKVLQRVKEKRLFPILTAMDLVWTENFPRSWIIYIIFHVRSGTLHWRL